MPLLTIAQIKNKKAPSGAKNCLIYLVGNAE
jgi:hypothetical protein